MPRKAGRGDPIITEQKIVAFLEDRSPPLAGTTQIANHFDVARPSAIERLETLEDRGVVGKRKVGQSYAWYLEDWKVEAPAAGGGGAGSSAHTPREHDELDLETTSETGTWTSLQHFFMSAGTQATEFTFLLVLAAFGSMGLNLNPVRQIVPPALIFTFLGSGIFAFVLGVVFLILAAVFGRLSGLDWASAARAPAAHTVGIMKRDLTQLMTRYMPEQN